MTETKPNYPLAILVVVGLALLGGVLGRSAGPAFSRTHYLVKAAERLYLEESQNLEEETLQTTAIRIQGIPPAQIYAEAREVQKKFLLAATLFGLWCGLISGLKIVAIQSERRRGHYEADQAHCLACSRCYLSCPIERTRLKKLKSNPAT